jgi:hypothetical protein
MNKIVLMFSFLILASCSTPEPLPVPPIPPLVIYRYRSLPPPPHAAEHREFQKRFKSDNAELQVYKSRPACAPSGDVDCYDEDRARAATTSGARAHKALSDPRRTKIIRHRANERVNEFHNDTQRLLTSPSTAP